MTLVGPVTAIGTAQRGAMSRGFPVVPLATVIVFPSLVIAALVMRRRPESHKCLMGLATVEVLTAAVGRWPVVRDWGALGITA
jgi:hypothetical protein